MTTDGSCTSGDPSQNPTALAAQHLKMRRPQQGDAEAVRAIDAAGLATGHATFRSDPYDWDAWWRTYATGSGVGLVAEQNGRVVGWAGIVSISDRCTYSGVGEVSVYVAPSARGTGVGRRLLAGLIEASEDAGYWTLVAQCFPENKASVAVHEAEGFRRLGIRERLGRMTYGARAGDWRDVMMLERRSDRVGQ